MEKPNSSNSRKAAAARANGRKGGTKNKERSRWNALRHGLNAKLTIGEGKHLPEYGQYMALYAALVKSLRPSSILEFMTIEKFVIDAWRLARALRYELSATEKPDAGMSCHGMPNLLRYLAFARRQYANSFEQVEIMALAAAHRSGAREHDLVDDEPTASHPFVTATLLESVTANADTVTATPSGDPESSLEAEPSNLANAVPSAAADDTAPSAHSCDPGSSTPATEEGENSSPGEG